MGALTAGPWGFASVARGGNGWGLGAGMTREVDSVGDFMPSHGEWWLKPWWNDAKPWWIYAKHGECVLKWWVNDYLVLFDGDTDAQRCDHQLMVNGELMMNGDKETDTVIMLIVI